MYTRLSKLGVSVSHRTATRLVRKLGVNHDREVLQWKSQCSSTPSQLPRLHEPSHCQENCLPQEQLQSGDEDTENDDQNDDESQVGSIESITESRHSECEPCNTLPSSKYPQYILVGDNLDKNITPRDMRVDNQVKSIHYFHSYAVQDRIQLSDLYDDLPECNIGSLPVTTFVPSVEDCATLRANYIVLAARVIVDKLPYFSDLHQCVMKNIPHQYSEAMQKKSVMVSCN